MNKLLYPILAIIAAVGLYFFYIGPAWSDIQALQSQKTQFEGALSDAEEIKSTLDRLNTTRDSIPQSDLKRLQTFLPPKIDVTHTIQNLNNILTRDGVRVHGITPGTVETDKQNSHLGTINFSFEIAATYEQFKQVLADIEKSLQLADVVSLDISPAGSKDNTSSDPEEKGLSQFGFNLTLYTYTD